MVRFCLFLDKNCLFQVVFGRLFFTYFNITSIIQGDCLVASVIKALAFMIILSQIYLAQDNIMASPYITTRDDFRAFFKIGFFLLFLGWSDYTLIKSALM